jgi:hypothetical protein
VIISHEATSNLTDISTNGEEGEGNCGIKKKVFLEIAWPRDDKLTDPALPEIPSGQTGLKPCGGRPFVLESELKSEIQKGNSGLHPDCRGFLGLTQQNHGLSRTAIGYLYLNLRLR